jgi:signal transduction histidine kinase
MNAQEKHRRTQRTSTATWDDFDSLPERPAIEGCPAEQCPLVVRAASSARTKSLATLAGGVAHEVNTPLGSLRANIDSTRRAVDALRDYVRNAECAAAADERLQRALRVLDDTLPRMSEATGRIEAVVQALSAFARLDRAPVTSIDLHQSIDAALELLRPRMGARAKVARDYGELPQVTCHAEGMHQTLLAVLCNAVQAIEGSGTISIVTRAEGDRVLIGIADDGPGIAPEHLPRIFDPGFTTRPRGVAVGAGLGLAIAYRTVEDHGGTIEVRSKQGQGTEVTIELPVRPRTLPT